jgi:hypothetical protein
MNIHRHRALVIVIGIVCCYGVSITSAKSQEIWFGPLHTTDVMDLVGPDAPWMLLDGASQHALPKSSTGTLTSLITYYANRSK